MPVLGSSVSSSHLRNCSPSSPLPGGDPPDPGSGARESSAPPGPRAATARSRPPWRGRRAGIERDATCPPGMISDTRETVARADATRRDATAPNARGRIARASANGARGTHDIVDGRCTGARVVVPVTNPRDTTSPRARCRYCTVPKPSPENRFNDDDHVSLDDDDESRLVVTRRSPPETRRERKKCDTRMTCVGAASLASTRFSPFCVVHAPSPDPFAIRSRRLRFTA